MAEQFSTTRSLSGSAPRITRAVSATAPVPTAPAPAPEDESSVTAAAKSIGSSALSGLSMLGNLLDLPGSMIRDVLVADNPFDQLLDPLSHQSTGRSVDGREMLSRNLLTGLLFSPNKETGISGWADDPMEGVQDIAGFAAELALDPLSWLTGGVAKAPGMFGDLAKAASTPARAGKLGKLDKGLQIINELDPGTHVGRALGIPQALAKRSRAAHAAKMFEQTAGPERERVYSELKNTVGQEQADAVIRTGAARAATWASESEGRTPDEFFKKVRVQKSTPGEIGSGALNQGEEFTPINADVDIPDVSFATSEKQQDFQQLLRSGSVPDSDLEKMVSDPDLADLVKSEIGNRKLYNMARESQGAHADEMFKKHPKMARRASGNENLNKWIRGGTEMSAHRGEWTGEDMQFLSSLQDAASTSPPLPNDMVGVRQVRKGDIAYLIEKMNVGDVSDMKAPTAVSLNPNYAKSQRESGNDLFTHFTFELPKGTKGFWFNASEQSRIKKEHELLLPVGTKYKVIEKSTDDAGRLNIRLRIVDQSNLTKIDFADLKPGDSFGGRSIVDVQKVDKKNLLQQQRDMEKTYGRGRVQLLGDKIVAVSDEKVSKVLFQSEISKGALNQGPSAPDTPEFKNWFGDYITDPPSASKVVGQDGRPLVVYHGTGTPDLGTAAAKENNINLAKNREEWAKYKSAEKDAGPARKAALKNEEAVRGQFASAVSDVASKKNAHLPFSSSDYDFTSRESLAKSIYKQATYPEREAMWNKGTFREIGGVVTTSIDDSTFSKLQKAHQEWMNAEAQRKSINPRPKSDEKTLSSFQNEDPVFQTMRYGANDPGYYAAGTHFTDNTDEAGRYAMDQKTGNPGVIPAYLNMRKPYILGETKDPQVEQFINDAVDARRQIAQVKRKGDLDELARAFAVGRTEGLQKAGYDGMVVKTKVGTEYIVFKPEQIKSVNNKGSFDPNNPSILHQSATKGAIEFSKDNDAIIHIFENGDVSTAIHEFFHYFRRELPENLLNQAADSIGVKSGKWDRTAEEAFASMGERYALEGKAPTPALRAVFEKFKEWMTNIYSSLDGTPLDQNIHPNLRQVFDDMLGGKAAAENMPTTMADRAFEALDGYSSIFQAKAKSAVQSAYDSAPQPVKSTADFIRTEAGQKVDALTRWTMSAFNNRVDNRMTETGQQSAKVMTAIQDDLTRKFSEPVIQTLSDIAHYGPDGTADIKASLREGQTIEDWHSEFSDALMYAMEKGDTEPLARLAPEGLPADAPNPFVESYTRLKAHGDRILQEQRAAGVDIGDLTDVIDHMFRQMNPRLADWRAARELMPNAGEGTGTVTREDLFRGFYSGTGGKVASGVNRITADPDVLAAVRRSAAAKDPGPSAAGDAVAKVIESKYAGDVDPRMPVVTSSGRFQFRDVSKIDLPTTPAAPPVSPAASAPPAASPAFTGDQQKIDELLSKFEKIFVDSTGKPSERIVRDQVIGLSGFDPDMVDAVIAARKSAPPAPPKITRTAPVTPTAATAAKPAPLFDLSKSELSSYYRRVPEAAEREFSTAAGDAFDLPSGTPFDMQNPIHRAEVFRNRTPIKYEKIAGDPDDPRFQELPDIIHQEFSDRWKELGRYLWGSDEATSVQRMVDHTNAVELNGGVFGRHALLNQQRYNQMAAKRIATARHFTDVFEGGLRTGQIRNPDALTPQALSQTVGRNIERSAGVKLGDIFDSLEGSYDRDKIYQNSYQRLAASDPQTFDAFMKDAELPEGMEDIADELGDLDMPKELDMDAFRAHMDNLVVDQELAQEIKGLHRTSETQSPGIKSLKTLAATLSAQWKAGVLSFPSTQVRNYTSGAIANMYSGIWSGLSHAAGEDVLFNRPNDLLQELPEVVAYMQKRGLDPSDPMSPTRAAREMYAIEKGHLASESRDFVGQANSADDMTDIDHMFGLLPGHRNIRSRKELGTEYLATLAGKREASWRDPFDIAGTTRVLGPNKGTTRAESNFAPVSAINIWGKASDDANRLAGWVEGMRQGKSSREAFRRVDQVQLNYDPSKFTDVERKLKVIFPFYSFFSRQTAYFANELMTNPAGKLGKLIRLMNSSQTDEYLPEHVREGGAIPLGVSEDGTENYITSMGLMFEDVPKTLIPNSSDDLARNLLSKANPLIKAPVEYALGRSLFQGGPLGGRSLDSMDPLLGRILTQLGVQEALPNQNARPAFGSPMLEHALANSPLSRLLSTTKTLVDSPERKSILDKAIITLTGMRITSVSPEQRQRGIRELTNKLSQDLGARAFDTYHISQALLDDAKVNDPEKYQKLMEIKKLRAHWDKVQRIKRKEQAKEAVN